MELIVLPLVAIDVILGNQLSAVSTHPLPRQRLDYNE
jgi:hypothetical protein